MPGPVILRNSHVTNFPPQNDVYGSIDPLEYLESVEAFTEPGFKGDHQSFPVGRHDLADFTIPNDSISSVTVPPGLRVTLFEHEGFTGASTIVKGDTKGLCADVDGTTSSLIVEEI